MMPNHFHLCFETPNPNLSIFLQRFMTRVSRELNMRRDRSGHLFQGRTQSLLVEDQFYFETLIAYILWNPVRARLCDNPMQYPWSSSAAMFERPSKRLEVRKLAERIAGRNLPDDPAIWRTIFMKWIHSAEEQRKAKEDAYRKGKRGQFLSTGRFRKQMLNLSERRNVSPPIESKERKRRFSDKPIAAWSWNAMRETVDHELDHSDLWRDAWDNKDRAEHELTVWIAHEDALWTYDKIRRANDDRHSLSRYSMIITRIRNHPRRTAFAEKLRQRLA